VEEEITEYSETQMMINGILIIWVFSLFSNVLQFDVYFVSLSLFGFDILTVYLYGYSLNSSLVMLNITLLETDVNFLSNMFWNCSVFQK